MPERKSITLDFQNQLPLSRSDTVNLSVALNSYQEAQAVVLKLEGEIRGYEKQLQDAVGQLKDAHAELNSLLTRLNVPASEAGVGAVAA